MLFSDRGRFTAIQAVLNSSLLMLQVTVKTQVTSPPTILGDTLENGCTALPEVASSLMHETNALIPSIKENL